jgi:hypothetical protein
MLDTTPARWRLGQALVVVPLALLATAAFGPLLGLAVATGAVRTGARLLLRSRSGRRAAALERAAPVLARSLGAELAGGVGAEDALAAAAASLPSDDRILRPILATALVHTALGEAPGRALATAAAGAEDGGRGLITVATVLAIQERGGGDPGSFDPLTAEARLAAVAVPALAGILAVTLTITEPAIGAGVTSPLAALAVVGCAAVALGGTVLARRMAAVP